MFSNAEQKFTQDFDASPSAAIATELGSAGVEFGVAKEMISAVALLLLFLLPFLLLVVLLPFNGYCCGTQTHIHTCPSKLARFGLLLIKLLLLALYIFLLFRFLAL